MANETPRETFRRLCGEMGLSESWRMTKAGIHGLRDEWFARAGYTREQALALEAARERMEAAESENAASNRSTGLHPIWAAANERLLARRSGNGGEHGQL
jgi:hypothetical protein